MYRTMGVGGLFVILAVGFIFGALGAYAGVKIGINDAWWNAIFSVLCATLASFFTFFIITSPKKKVP
jgi:hypothetical protein